MNPSKQVDGQTPRYISATSFNIRELMVVLLLAVIGLLMLAVPWLLGWFRALGGFDLDTYKALPEGAAPAMLVPNSENLVDIEMEGEVAVGRYSDSSLAAVAKCPSHQAAIAQWRLTEGSATEGMGVFLRRGKMEGQYFIEWVNGEFLLRLSAPTKAGLDELVLASDYIDKPGEPGYGSGSRPLMARLVFDYPLVFALLLDILIVAFMWGIFGLGLKLATRRPPKGASRISRDDLRERLLAMNLEESPFVLDEVAPYHLVGRWKLDVPAYYTLFGKHGLSEAYQIDLYLHSDGPVGALETRGTITWDLELDPPRASWNWNFFRGIVLFERKMQKVWAFDADDLKFKKVVDYNIDAAEFKQPIVKMVVNSGWTYRPVLIKPLVWRA